MCKQRLVGVIFFRLRLSRLLKEWDLDGSGELTIHSELYTIPRFTVGARPVFIAMLCACLRVCWLLKWLLEDLLERGGGLRFTRHVSGEH
jgi:hypothetical protein